MKDIAEYIGIHYTRVSRAIKKNERKMKSDISRPFNVLELEKCYQKQKRILNYEEVVCKVGGLFRQ